jgi:MFS family permease
MGISASGRSIGDMNYLLEIAPERERPSYIGFMNTYMIPFSFLPLIGGVIVEAVSFNAILLISMISNLLSALLCSRGLREVREVEEDG